MKAAAALAALVALTSPYGGESHTLGNTEVAKVRDQLVSFLELTISRMNATSTLDASQLVSDIVDGTSSTTGLVVGKAGIKHKAGEGPTLLNSTLLASARGELVSHLEIMIGKMNSTAKVDAQALLDDLIDEIAAVTGVPSAAVPLVPGFSDVVRLRLSMHDAMIDGVGLLPLTIAYLAGACLTALALALAVWTHRLAAKRVDPSGLLTRPVLGGTATSGYARVVS